jgi:hypothetical protein
MPLPRRIVIVREGSGTGEGKAPTPGQAHEIALKSAETDATKRALATFGNAFGLALYDREQSGVRHRADKVPTQDVAQGPWTLLSATGATLGKFAVPEEFDKALRESMTKAESIESLFAVWEHNIGIVRALNHIVKHKGTSDFAKGLVDHLKSCAVGLIKPRDETRAIHLEIEGSRDQADSNVPGENIDKSALVFGEPKRHRSKEHLRFVASQPCLVCGRIPSQAHHIRFAQSKGLALKVSDEFTVPLCAIHHNENHRTGNERHWWSERKIDPLAAAKGLWKRSFGGSTETSS